MSLFLDTNVFVYANDARDPRKRQIAIHRIAEAVAKQEAVVSTQVDGCILAAAEHAACDAILSEDLNPGRLYAGVRVENPFV